MKKLLPIMLILALFLGAGDLTATIAPDELVRKSQGAFYYPGKDFKARVVMRLTSGTGQERVREMTMLRKNYGESGGEQKYFIYFFRPADVKDMTFMVEKFPGRDADRWLFIPAINMTRRIAAQDRYSSFVGSDFTYEDVSGRNPEDDNHTLEREEQFAGKACAVVKSVPKAADMEYSAKLSWIDLTSFLPLKEEYYDRQDALYKVFTADEIKEVGGFPTVLKRTMKNLQSGHATEVTYTRAEYDIGIEDALFSERFLRQPPQKWIE
ncbi:MAG: outer membrane lipoprotein-sorting protein [Desulfobulbaceae bacterium]